MDVALMRKSFPHPWLFSVSSRRCVSLLPVSICARARQLRLFQRTAERALEEPQPASVIRQHLSLDAYRRHGVRLSRSRKYRLPLPIPLPLCCWRRSPFEGRFQKSGCQRKKGLKPVHQYSPAPQVDVSSVRSSGDRIAMQENRHGEPGSFPLSGRRLS